MNQTILTNKQSTLIEQLITKHGEIVTTKQIHSLIASDWDTQQTKNLITKLVKNGWLIRLKQGLYAISSLDSRGFLTITPEVVAGLLVPDSYVSFESALSYHGMFDQLTSKTVSLALGKTRSYKVEEREYQYISTKPKLLFGWQDVLIDHRDAKIASPEKALIDMVNFHKSKYSLDLVITKLQHYQQDLDLELLMTYLGKFSTTTVKIFGYIFDLIGIDSSYLISLINTQTGTSWMLEGDAQFNAKWRLYYDPYFDKYHSS